jgi:phosphoribosylformylglycinamidine synthase I
MTMRVPAVVMTAPGSNRDPDALFALEQAGADARLVSVYDLLERPTLLDEARLVMLAGGFTYGDALGAGKLWALDLTHRLGQTLSTHVEHGRPLLGVCNGFQALVQAGFLPGAGGTAALGPNANGRFECRWVTLTPVSERCIWTRHLDEPIDCPVAHGEGRFVADEATLARLEADDLVALRYATTDGGAAKGDHPANPNGSINDIAGICDPTGLVLGLMPHPEDHAVPRQHPRHRRGVIGRLGLSLFREGVRYADGL